jgi:hypothetical protein
MYLCMYVIIFPPIPTHVHIDIVVSLPGCVTDFRGWDAHKAQLRCPDYLSDDMCERGVPAYSGVPRRIWGFNPLPEITKF